ncbi:type II toxin-antitoxin system YafQ family toxin [Fusobacterium pseudoperiodonticum]|jgi:addiction module toxin, relE/stbE family|uniref:type II toxin-antitoxin system YafQ family toxin n=1 Tax=Fusobacterium pseudoperiodonticum TaxID=2663009 RepID=UPI00290B4A58|nr:type II toxin-antitoxin system YafQ family toxin [Fusobacterium periodonticum]
MTKKEIKYELDFTSKFKKDVKLLKKQGKNIEKLYEIINILACGEELDAKYRDHNLIGNYKGYRECHIESDWLLIYKIMENILILTLSRTGTHSELFKK